MVEMLALVLFYHTTQQNCMCRYNGGAFLMQDSMNLSEEMVRIKQVFEHFSRKNRIKVVVWEWIRIVVDVQNERLDAFFFGQAYGFVILIYSIDLNCIAGCLSAAR